MGSFSLKRKYFQEWDKNQVLDVLRKTKDTEEYLNPSKLKKLMKITGGVEALAEADNWGLREISSKMSGNGPGSYSQEELIKDFEDAKPLDPSLYKLTHQSWQMFGDDRDKFGDKLKPENLKKLSESERKSFLQELIKAQSGNMEPIGGNELITVSCGTSMDKVKAFLKGEGGVATFQNGFHLPGHSNVGFQVHKGGPEHARQRMLYYANRQASSGFSDPVIFTFQVPAKYVYQNPAVGFEYFVPNDVVKEIKVTGIEKLVADYPFKRVTPKERNERLSKAEEEYKPLRKSIEDRLEKLRDLKKNLGISGVHNFDADIEDKISVIQKDLARWDSQKDKSEYALEQSKWEIEHLDNFMDDIERKSSSFRQRPRKSAVEELIGKPKEEKNKLGNLDSVIGKKPVNNSAKISESIDSRLEKANNRLDEIGKKYLGSNSTFISRAKQELKEEAEKEAKEEWEQNKKKLSGILSDILEAKKKSNVKNIISELDSSKSKITNNIVDLQKVMREESFSDYFRLNDITGKYATIINRQKSLSGAESAVTEVEKEIQELLKKDGMDAKDVILKSFEFNRKLKDFKWEVENSQNTVRQMNQFASGMKDLITKFKAPHGMKETFEQFQQKVKNAYDNAQAEVERETGFRQGNSSSRPVANSNPTAARNVVGNLSKGNSSAPTESIPDNLKNELNDSIEKGKSVEGVLKKIENHFKNHWGKYAIGGSILAAGALLYNHFKKKDNRREDDKDDIYKYYSCVTDNCLSKYFSKRNECECKYTE